MLVCYRGWKYYSLRLQPRTQFLLIVFFIRLANLLPISESTRRKSPFYGKSTKKKWLLMKRHAKNSRTLSCPCLNSNRPCAQFLKLRRSCYLLTSSIGFKVSDLLATFIRLSSPKLVQQKQNDREMLYLLFGMDPVPTGKN